jgi:hypothetical protein
MNYEVSKIMKMIFKLIIYILSLVFKLYQTMYIKPLVYLNLLFRILQNPHKKRYRFHLKYG